MDWLTTNTFHHSAFADAGRLAETKRARGWRLAVCLPTWNEEKTIGPIIRVLREKLVLETPLIDSLVVIDSGSSDATCQNAREAGAEVFASASILPEFGFRRGKGENLWKSLYAVDADIFCFIDADIRNMDPRFVCGLVGPLLASDAFGYVKAFYRRPRRGDGTRAADRGRAGDGDTGAAAVFAFCSRIVPGDPAIGRRIRGAAHGP